MGVYGRRWVILGDMGDYGILWEYMGYYGRLWDILGYYRILWEVMLMGGPLACRRKVGWLISQRKESNFITGLSCFLLWGFKEQPILYLNFFIDLQAFKTVSLLFWCSYRSRRAFVARAGELWVAEVCSGDIVSERYSKWVAEVCIGDIVSERYSEIVSLPNIAAGRGDS